MLKKVAILTNGGDVAGFNAVIRAIVKTAEENDIECYGFVDGYRGLLNNDYIRLSTSGNRNASGILAKGGSIIGSSILHVFFACVLSALFLLPAVPPAFSDS